MELKNIFNAWAKSTQKKYPAQPWLLSKWEVLEGIHWPDSKIDLMLQSIRAGLRLNREDTLLDLGCAGGWIARALLVDVRRIYALDIAREMLVYARETLSPGSLICGEIGKLPLKSASMPKVLSYFVFMNFREDEYVFQSLEEILRILKKGGMALIGQLPLAGSAAVYDQAKKDYEAYCAETYVLGADLRRTYAPPIKVFKKEILLEFLKRFPVSVSVSESFNPFYRPGVAPTVPWRFDLVIQKM